MHLSRTDALLSAADTALRAHYTRACAEETDPLA